MTTYNDSWGKPNSGSTTNFNHVKIYNCKEKRCADLCKSIQIKRGQAVRENYNFIVDIFYNCFNKMQQWNHNCSEIWNIGCETSPCNSKGFSTAKPLPSLSYEWETGLVNLKHWKLKRHYLDLFCPSILSFCKYIRYYFQYLEKAGVID